MTEEDISRYVRGFVTESNHIEGIDRHPTGEELAATRSFLQLSKITVGDLTQLVNVYAPGHVLRDKDTLNVRVGRYVAPRGGLELVGRLGSLLNVVNHLRDNRDAITAYHAHVEYENLHPFTDGNGRSGRALWAWCMLRRSEGPFALGFLHKFYYQTLEYSR